MKTFLLALFLIPILVFAQPQKREIAKEIIVNASLTEVWNAWTTNEGIQSFFAPASEIKLEVNGPYRIYFAPDAEPGKKGADSMSVLAFEPEKMLSFTWTAPPYYPSIRGQLTVVTLYFEKVSNTQTKVNLYNSGYGTGEKWNEVYEYFSKAWTAVLNNLQTRFVSGPLKFK